MPDSTPRDTGSSGVSTDDRRCHPENPEDEEALRGNCCRETRARGGWAAAGASVRDEIEDAADVVLLFADDVAAVHADVVGAAGLVPDGGRLWVAYRKGARALNRDTLQHALGEHGLVGVTLVALDETWSAMRVRPLRPGETPRASR